jgi:hypothetical protein
MDLPTFRSLLSTAGQEVLQAALQLGPQETDFLGCFDALNRRYPAELARVALETAILRQEAVAKFPFASQMYFTRPALEQASGYEIAAYRARRFEGRRRLVDLGCSVGGDTLALAGQAPTIGVDLDPLRLAMARTNLEALGLEERAALVQADLRVSLPLQVSSSDGLFFDPARRSEGKRVFSVRNYQPPLAIIESWLLRCPALGVKISPGVRSEEIGGFKAEVEFISLRGELKEAVLWFGPLRSARRRATLLPGPHTLTASEADLGTEQRLPLSEPLAYIYEPDPAILRAGLVQALGEQLNAAQLDADIAYLTADKLVQTPFARAWAIEDWLPFGIKRLRAVLRQRGVGRVVVKKRGSPLSPEELIGALHLEKGNLERVLFLTHLRGKPIVIVCYPLL